MWKIGEDVTVDPILKKIEISEKRHDPISSGDHPDGSSDDGRHLPDRGICHLGIYYKHLPGEREMEEREEREGKRRRRQRVQRSLVMFSDLGLRVARQSEGTDRKAV